jgi:hypothetical protein
MNEFMQSTPSTDEVMALIRGELSSHRRWFYRGVLLAASVGLAAILSLWTTEPRPLPLRLHVAFAGLTLINVAWIGVLSWTLLRRYCPTALDRIATAWVATGACTLFLLMAVSIALVRGQMGEAMWIGVVGFVLFSVALIMLWRAYVERNKLQSRLASLERGRSGN